MQEQLTIHDYIDQLFADKQLLCEYLYKIGYRDFTPTDTYTLLVPKVTNLWDFVFNAHPTVDTGVWTYTGNSNSYWLANNYLKAAPLELNVTDDVTSIASLCMQWAGDTAPKINAKNVTNMCVTFADAAKIKTIDLSGIDMSKVTNITGMCYGTSELERVINGNNTDFSHITSLNGTFHGSKIRELHLPGASITDLHYAFHSCRWGTYTEDVVITLDVDVQNATSWDATFRAASTGGGTRTANSKKIYVDLSTWKNNNTVNLRWAFLECFYVTFDLRNFDFTKTSGNTWFSYNSYCTVIVADAEQKAAFKAKGYQDNGTWPYNTYCYTVEEWEALQNG